MIFALKSYLYDIRREVRYLLKPDEYSQNRYLAKIQLRNHIIEKGLSMHSFRPGFGRDNLFSLVGLCSDYAAGGYDTGEPVFRSTVALLKEYRRVHQEAGYNLDADIIKLIDGFTAGFGDISPLRQRLCSPDTFFAQTSDFREFARSRHSLRDFGEGSIPVETIKAAVELAGTAPSACNRQSARVHLVSGEKLKAIMKLHKGSRGFGDKADKLIVLSVDMASYFGIGERNLHGLDAGIFAMNLLYALHYYKVGACALNWCLPAKEDKALRALLDIPDNEEVTMLIACGTLPDRDFLTAASERCSIDKILTVH